LTEQVRLTWKGRLIAFGLSTLLCVVAVEGGARLFERDGGVTAAMQLDMRPYMMFAGHPMTNPVWRNVETKTDVPSQMKFNNLGFMGDVPFSVPANHDFLQTYAKKPGEKLILITGGSVVHGVGATANDKTTAAQLEDTLNSTQSTYKYRVINLGMGSWIAYQQFIGLSLFGLPLTPDWIVVMDGHNDAAVSCPHGSGAGNPMGWPQMLYLTGGGEGTARKGPLLRWSIRNSAIARAVTGLSPEGQNNQLQRLEFDDEDPDKRFTIKLRGLTMAELDKQVDFYIAAQQNVKELFSSAHVIFSSQPLLHDNAISPFYRKAFDLQATGDQLQASKVRLRADLDAYIAKNSATKCNERVSAPSLGYFMARSALQMEQIAPQWSGEARHRTIRYANTEMIFPSVYDFRLSNFIDNAHMTDLGQRRVAEYFAGFILETDLGVPFDVRAFAESIEAQSLQRKKLGK